MISDGILLLFIFPQIYFFLSILYFLSREFTIFSFIMNKYFHASTVVKTDLSLLCERACVRAKQRIHKQSWVHRKLTLCCPLVVSSDSNTSESNQIQ